MVARLHSYNLSALRPVGLRRQTGRLKATSQLQQNLQQVMQHLHKFCRTDWHNLVRVPYYAGTCNLQPTTASRPTNGISRLLTERAPDWQAWNVAPPISFFITFTAVVTGLLQVACCNLQLTDCNF